MRKRIVTVTGDDNALTRSKTVVLHHIGRTESIKGRRCLVDVCAHERHGCRDFGFSHDLLGEGLAAFELGCRSGWPEAGDSVFAHRVSGTGHEGHFRSDDNQVDIQSRRQVGDRLRVSDVNRHGVEQACDTRIARCNDDSTHSRVAEKSRRQSVLACPATYDEDLHAASLVKADSRDGRLSADVVLVHDREDLLEDGQPFLCLHLGDSARRHDVHAVEVGERHESALLALDDELGHRG